MKRLCGYGALLLVSVCILSPSAACSAGQADVFQRADRNGDGLIEPSEFPGAKEKFFALDTNGDGYLSREELQATMKQVSERSEQMSASAQGAPQGHQGPPGGHNGQGGPGGMGGPGGPGDMNGKGGQGFEQDDANKDGKVSREEFSGPADLFDKLDANNDGYITQEEAGQGQGPNGPPPRQ